MGWVRRLYVAPFKRKEWGRGQDCRTLAVGCMVCYFFLIESNGAKAGKGVVSTSKPEVLVHLMKFVGKECAAADSISELDFQVAVEHLVWGRVLVKLIGELDDSLDLPVFCESKEAVMRLVKFGVESVNKSLLILLMQDDILTALLVS